MTAPRMGQRQREQLRARHEGMGGNVRFVNRGGICMVTRTQSLTTYSAYSIERPAQPDYPVRLAAVVPHFIETLMRVVGTQISRHLILLDYATMVQTGDPSEVCTFNFRDGSVDDMCEQIRNMADCECSQIHLTICDTAAD